jgi:hypothetical protein
MMDVPLCAVNRFPGKEFSTGEIGRANVRLAWYEIGCPDHPAGRLVSTTPECCQGRVKPTGCSSPGGEPAVP